MKSLWMGILIFGSPTLAIDKYEQMSDQEVREELFRLRQEVNALKKSKDTRAVFKNDKVDKLSLWECTITYKRKSYSAKDKEKSEAIFASRRKCRQDGVINTYCMLPTCTEIARD